MPIRFVISQTRKHARTLALAAALALPALARAGDDDVALTLGEARQIAVHALQNGNPGLAAQLARGLLKANPDDGFAYYIIASAEAQQNRPTASRKAASKAFRHAAKPVDKFSAAQLAARMAYTEERYSLSQFWLRRSAIHAPDEKAEQVVARDYTTLRRINPWAFRVQADLRPSSNVNKGSDTALQIIDGVPVTGMLSGNAQALSGLIGTLDLFASYRLNRGERSATSLSGRLYIQRVALSDDAKAQAPMATNSDYASTYGELALRHGFLAGKPGSGGTGAVELAYGESWNRTARSFSFVRLSGDRGWRLGSGATLKIDALYEDRFDARVSVNDARVLGFGGQYRQPLANGDRLTFSMALRDSDAKHDNGTYQSASVRASYDFGKPVGPMRLRAGLTLGYTDYPVFRSAGFLTVPGGRQDSSVYGDVSMFFHEMDYAGFAPMLRLRAGKKSSNDSRYSMREMSLSLGIESKF
ncbi:hypothetical protein LCL97_04685 [Seohaeicola saemankumensis]|nr:hypothetical protein [Seohaeicola saemankumensis]MCA0870106.1 hypothetical protein [Seohaeicola saemankumensis]